MNKLILVSFFAIMNINMFQDRMDSNKSVLELELDNGRIIKIPIDNKDLKRDDLIWEKVKQAVPVNDLDI